MPYFHVALPKGAGAKQKKVKKTKKKLKRQEFEKTESQRRKVEMQLTHLQSFAQMLYQIPSELSATGEV